MTCRLSCWNCRSRRSPHGERGLKYGHGVKPRGLSGRSPHGERGLKLIRRIDNVVGKVVALLMESVD